MTRSLDKFKFYAFLSEVGEALFASTLQQHFLRFLDKYLEAIPLNLRDLGIILPADSKSSESLI